LDETGSVVVLPWRSYDNAAAAGAVGSSAADMANWLILHLNGGRFEERQMLKEGRLRQIQATQKLQLDAKQIPLLESSERYAMGWRRSEYRGHTHLAHGGGIIGFPAYMALLPDCKAGVVVLANSWGSWLSAAALHKAIAFSALDQLLGATTRDWRKE